MDNKIKSKWGDLIQRRPNARGMIGNSKLIGSYIGHNSNHDTIFNFITTKGTFFYNETTDEFKGKLQIR